MFICIVAYSLILAIAGPTSLAQFCIWERGDVDMRQLVDKIEAAMRHALCDIVMEYRLLTAPICEVPPHYTRGADSPYHSAPPSPVGKEGKNGQLSEIVGRDLFRFN